MRLAENEIALLRYRNRLTAGCCVSSTATKARFVTQDGSTVNVPAENVLLAAGRAGRTAAEAAAFWVEAEAAGATLDLAAVWDLVRDEGQAWAPEELADLVGNEEALLAPGLLIALEESDYFVAGDSGYLARTEGEVADLLAARDAAEERARERSRLGGWLEGSVARSEVAGDIGEWADRLKDYVLRDGGGAHAGWVERSVGRAIQPRRVFDRLVEAGIWARHTHLDLERFDVPVAFGEEALAEARAAAEPGEGAWRDREDLARLRVYTIDEATTRDIDDGISVEFYEDGTACVGIHIADAGAFVGPGSALDKAAADRLTSLYFPDLKVPMLPGELSDGAISLVEGALRPAISTLVRVDGDGDVVDVRVARTRIRVQRRLSYAEADALLEQPRERDHSALRFLHAFAEARLVERRQAGAVLVDSREVMVTVRDDGTTSLSRVDASSPAALTVSELMVMANAAAADLARREGVPMLYRGQAAPDLSDLTEQMAPGLHRFRVLQRMRPAELGVAPIRHGGLALEAYCQSSSPIRRYVDMVVQRQVAAVLGGNTPPLSEDDLQAFVLGSQDRLRQLSRIERRRKTYWLMVHLQACPGETYEAVFLEERGRDAWVDIDPLDMQVGVRPIPNAAPGETVRITLASADPWEGTATFHLAADP